MLIYIKSIYKYFIFIHICIDIIHLISSQYGVGLSLRDRSVKLYCSILMHSTAKSLESSGKVQGRIL